MVYEVKTKLSPERVLEEAMKFFGAGGLGLEVSQQASDCATFTGGGGHVTVSACQEDQRTSVELETREWDYQVKQFMQRLSR